MMKLRNIRIRCGLIYLAWPHWAANNKRQNQDLNLQKSGSAMCILITDSLSVGDNKGWTTSTGKLKMYGSLGVKYNKRNHRIATWITDVSDCIREGQVCSVHLMSNKGRHCLVLFKKILANMIFASTQKVFIY